MSAPTPEMHDALTKIGERSAEIEREGRAYPTLADKLGIARGTVTRLERGRYIVRKYNVLGDAVDLTTKGHDYLMQQRGLTDLDALIAGEQGALIEDTRKLREQAEEYRRDRCPGPYSNELAQGCERQARDTEGRAEGLRRVRVTLRGGPVPTDAERARYERMAVERDERKRQADTQAAAEAAERAERWADHAEMETLKDRIEAGLPDLHTARTAAARRARKAYGLPTAAETKRLVRSYSAVERATGEVAEKVATAAAELELLRMARANNQRQVDSVNEIISAGGLRPGTVAKLRAGCERLTRAMQEQDTRIVEREKALADAVAEWKAGPQPAEPMPTSAAPTRPIKTLAEEKAERLREQDAFFERLRAGAAVAERAQGGAA